jgi:hypothetical protein
MKLIISVCMFLLSSAVLSAPAPFYDDCEVIFDEQLKKLCIQLESQKPTTIPPPTRSTAATTTEAATTTVATTTVSSKTTTQSTIDSLLGKLGNVLNMGSKAPQPETTTPANEKLKDQIRDLLNDPAVQKQFSERINQFFGGTDVVGQIKNVFSNGGSAAGPLLDSAAGSASTGANNMAAQLGKFLTENGVDLTKLGEQGQRLLALVKSEEAQSQIPSVLADVQNGDDKSWVGKLKDIWNANQNGLTLTAAAEALGIPITTTKAPAVPVSGAASSPLGAVEPSKLQNLIANEVKNQNLVSTLSNLSNNIFSPLVKGK